MARIANLKEMDPRAIARQIDDELKQLFKASESKLLNNTGEQEPELFQTAYGLAEYRTNYTLECDKRISEILNMFLMLEYEAFPLMKKSTIIEMWSPGVSFLLKRKKTGETTLMVSVVGSEDNLKNARKAG